MPIELLELLPGHRFTIYAICLRGDCATKEFLEQAESQNKDEADSMLALLNWTAQSGPPRNKEKCRNVGDGIYEFKAKGLRICWFYDAGRMIICSHGFCKGTQKVQNRELSQGRKTRDEYFAAKNAGPIPIKKP